ncbi:hypothetical protein Hamer_G007838 [Homarus americanus]|uniref:Uncharacterized protein n=3 Tax=Homarus americanus TaxID=6706 RepID=A0A8J5MSW5_HOMAM|nr:hypothetical protein Hamer_G007838 [Homarus americanus]
MALTENGLYSYWSKFSGPNATACVSPPTKITVKSSLSPSNLWGMFVVLVGGYAVGMLAFVLEILHSLTLHSPNLI